MDEVHYLADKFRGAVWEEILIHLPERIQVVSLSATVSNAEEFGEWLKTVRGETEVVLSEIRPVPLYQHILIGNRILDLFVDEGRVNPEIVRLEKNSSRRVPGHGSWKESNFIEASCQQSISFFLVQVATLRFRRAFAKGFLSPTPKRKKRLGVLSR
jgi:superfamily II RNA helicase